jgi:hypothetical protein
VTVFVAVAARAEAAFAAEPAHRLRNRRAQGDRHPRRPPSGGRIRRGLFLIGRAGVGWVIRVISVAVILPLSIAVAIAPNVASAKSFHCGDVRVDRFLHFDRDGDFGAFAVTRTGTSCKVARRVASRYVHDPRAIERRKRIEGWTCTHRTVDSQVVWVTCTRKPPSVARINFLNWLPSG